MPFGTCRDCGAFFEQIAAVCPVCGAPRENLVTSAPGDSYDHFASKVRLLPNLRARDNLFQAVFVAVTTILGTTILGVFGGWPMGVLSGAALGLLVGGLLSGGALMIRGFLRK
jgi:hypothetical protein